MLLMKNAHQILKNLKKIHNIYNNFSCKIWLVTEISVLSKLKIFKLEKLKSMFYKS